VPSTVEQYVKCYSNRVKHSTVGVGQVGRVITLTSDHSSHRVMYLCIHFPPFVELHFVCLFAIAVRGQEHIERRPAASPWL
jgi:hypothetical protein